MAFQEEERDAVAPTGPWTPPSYAVQQARTLGSNLLLRRYLREGGASRNVRRRTDYTRYVSAELHRQVKLWLRDTEDGRATLRACGVAPDAFSVDHVNPRHLGGHEHLHNYHVMPPGTNSHFRDRALNDPEKEAYVGTWQMELARDLARQAAQLPGVADIGA